MYNKNFNNETMGSSNGFYTLPVQEKSMRSRMNIPICIHQGSCPRPDLEKQFLKEAEAEGLVNLAGHRRYAGAKMLSFHYYFILFIMAF
jgi:phosphoserine aminotransferase